MNVVIKISPVFLLLFKKHGCSCVFFSQIQADPQSDFFIRVALYLRGNQGQDGAHYRCTNITLQSVVDSCLNIAMKPVCQILITQRSGINKQDTNMRFAGMNKWIDIHSAKSRSTGIIVLIFRDVASH